MNVEGCKPKTGEEPGRFFDLLKVHQDLKVANADGQQT